MKFICGLVANLESWGRHDLHHRVSISSVEDPNPKQHQWSWHPARYRLHCPQCHANSVDEVKFDFTPFLIQYRTGRV
jgi:cytochrome c-type biogenesis protein CcmH/NrfF